MCASRSDDYFAPSMAIWLGSPARQSLRLTTPMDGGSMKKYRLLAFLAVLALVFAACTSDNAETETTESSGGTTGGGTATTEVWSPGSGTVQVPCERKEPSP